MEICVAAAVTLWAATLVVSPRRPLIGNEVQELVYRRLLGRQHLLVLLASAVNTLALLTRILSLPTQMHEDLVRVRTPCEAFGYNHEHCYTYEHPRRAIATPTPSLYHGACALIDRQSPAG